MHDASSQLERAHENTDQGQFHLKKKHDKKNRVVEKSELKALTNTNTKGHKKERTSLLRKVSRKHSASVAVGKELPATWAAMTQ